MRLKQRPKRPAPESTVPLINVVFLMLIFFIFAGSLARDDARSIDPPTKKEKDDPVRSTNALVVDDKGKFFNAQNETSLDTFLSERTDGDGSNKPLILAPDADLSAQELAKVIGKLAEAGITDVILITRRDDQ